MSSALAAIDSPDMRRAGREPLSLALMDARNRTLQLLARFEEALGETLRVPPDDDILPPLWLAGHVGWLAEYWIARNPQRALGPRCPADGMRLASVEPRADGWFDPRLAARADRWNLDLPGTEAVRAYLLDSVETTLELLEHAPDEDDALHFFRMALFHEDRRGEDLVAIAQTVGIATGLALPRARRCCCRPRAGSWAGRGTRVSRWTSSAATNRCRCPSSRSTRSR